MVTGICSMASLPLDDEDALHRARLAARPRNPGELSRQLDAGARVVRGRQPLLVRRQASHVVHLEEELAGAEGVTRVLPGQLEQTKALRRALVTGNEVAMQVRADVGIVQI